MLPEPHEPSRRMVFQPLHDHLLRGALVLAGAGLVLVGALAYYFAQQPAWQRIDRAPEQPVPFSHRHHVAELGIDCRYCHTGVETSAFAGVPPTETCMTCHSQLWTNASVLQPVRDSAQHHQPLVWQQVTNLPDFVYFNHSAHITRGVACVSCHGRVDQMAMTFQPKAMTMSWCLSCHRQPEKHLVSHSEITNPQPARWGTQSRAQTPPGAGLSPVEKVHLTQCTTCHR